MTGRRLTPEHALWPQTAPLLTDNNAATLVHGANGQSTALETPGGDAPSAAVAAAPPAAAVAPAAGPMPLNGGLESAGAGPLTWAVPARCHFLVGTWLFWAKAPQKQHEGQNMTLPFQGF